MSLLKIITYPNKKLRIKSKKIKTINNKLQLLIDNMFETMYYYNGIGLAAPQINLNLELIVIDILKKKNSKIVLINPILESKKGFITIKEGCLSIPNFYINITRYNNLKINALDRYGNKITLKSSDLLSSCIQHEIDHLLGILIIDYK